MSGELKKSSRKMSGNLPSAISLRELGDGRLHSETRDGVMTDLFGREVVLAPPSQPAEKARGLMTLATSGRIGIDSSASAALQQSLENRLMERLDTDGSTLFNLTWKRKSTPLGRRYLERQAVAHRTGDRGFTSLPTPAAQEADGHFRPSRAATGRTTEYLGRTVCTNLAPVPTPCSQEDGKSVEAHLAMKKRMGERDGTNSNREAITSLQVTAKLSAVPTPNAMEGGQTSRVGKRYDEKLMGGIAKLAAVPTPDTVNTHSEKAKFHRPTSGPERGGPSFGLQDVANLATVPTPMAGTPAQNGYNEAGNTDYSRKMVELASVQTPEARNQDGYQVANGKRWLRLGAEARLATVAIPRSEDSECAGAHRGIADGLHSQAKLASISTPVSPRLEGHFGDVREWRGPGWLDPHTARSVAEAGATRGFWADCDWWYGRDGKYRPIEPGLFPLATWVYGRVGKLRGYGNAICVPVAEAFIRAYIDILKENGSWR